MRALSRSCATCARCTTLTDEDAGTSDVLSRTGNRITLPYHEGLNRSEWSRLKPSLVQRATNNLPASHKLAENGKVQVHQNHFHQKKIFIKIHFHQKPLSSKTTFIKNQFHQKTTFIKMPLSSKTTFIKNHFHQKPISSKTNFIKNQFHQKPFSSKTNFIKNQFHQSTSLSEGPTTRAKTT